jgi:hypothetical protein
VDTKRGSIAAEHVVVATHFPFPDRALFFVRMHAKRSYCAARGHAVLAATCARIVFPPRLSLTFKAGTVDTSLRGP